MKKEKKSMSERNEFGERNFFYSANSEAYQDAFLTWIFYNFTKDETKTEIEKFSKYFLEYLSKIGSNGEKIETVEVDTQVKNSDIILNIKTNKNEYLVIIEDKTGSSIHSSNKSDGEIYKTQLEKYYDKFMQEKKYKKYFLEKRVFLYYYKNDYVNEYEESIIIEANSRCKLLLKKQYEIEIEEKKKEISNLEANENERKSIDSVVNKYFREWEILDIKDINQLFLNFEKTIIKDKIHDQILKEYYQSIGFWNDQINRVNSMVLYSDKDPDFLWNPQSKIWNPIFVRLMNSIKEDSSEDRFAISTFNGKYWQFVFVSKNSRTCIVLDAKNISNNTVIISINLRNEKYKNNEGLPWENDKQREKDRKSIVDKFKELENKKSDKSEKINGVWKANKRSKSENSKSDINLLAKYTVKTSKTSLRFLIDTWKKVEEDLRDLEYTDFNNETIKVFER